MATISPTDATFPAPARVTTPEPQGATPQTPPFRDPADLRLVIEEDKANGSFIYMTINRRTGEVVAQFPQEQLMQMQHGVAFAAGTVISAKA